MSDDEVEREFVRVEADPGSTRVYVLTIGWPHPHTPASSWVLAAHVNNIYLPVRQGDKY